MKSSWYFSLLLLLLSACINGEQTFRADHTHFLSSGNSKVWMLKATQQNEQARLKRNSWGEILFVFYVTGEVLVGSFGDFDKGAYDKGHFNFNEDKEQLTIQINKEKWTFNIQTLNDDQIVLKTVKGKYLAAYLHLAPLTVPL
ncbi:MAG: hypothetical protein RL440_578 [Bacteroidota bacterium]|jgi:hypothetical protein